VLHGAASRKFSTRQRNAPAKIVPRLQLPYGQLATADQLSAAILRRDKSSPRQQQKRVDFSSVENIRGLICRRSAFSSPENYSCSGLGKHDVKRFWMMNYYAVAIPT